MLRVELKCYWWWQPLFYACKPRVRVDGSDQEARWGTTELPLAEGQHHVAIYFPYLHQPECGLAEADVDIRPGEVLTLRYSPPFTIMQPGRLRVS